MNSLVSIGIPTYNREEGLKKCLECIINQTYPNLRIIVADNCSDGENIRRIVQEFQEHDPRIEYYRHEINKGAAFNFQFVLSKATGDYFMWAADDDVFSLNYIEENLKAMQGDINIVGSYGLTNDGQQTWGNSQGNADNEANRFRRIRRYLRNPSYNMCFYSLFRLNIVKKTNGFDFDFFAGDWFFVAYMLKKGILLQTNNTYVVRGADGLSSNAARLLRHYYNNSKWLYAPFFKPMLKYFKIDFLSALINLDILIYHNLFFANCAWENFKPHEYSRLKKINRKFRSALEYFMSFSDRYLFRILR